MANYRSSVDGRIVSSETALGYPWILLDDDGDFAEPQKEIMVRTIEAIMLDVGDDAELAQEELTHELGRETPRTTLITRLRAVIAAAS